MDRRAVLSWMGAGLLTGCGGGGASSAAPAAPSADGVVGSGSTPVTGADAAPSAAPAPATPAPAVQALSANIACWGDSITDLYAPHLQAANPARQVYNGGVVGQTSMQIAARATADTAHARWISILWYGHNNPTKDPVKADIAATVAALAPGNRAFIVLSMLTWAQSGARGTAEYAETLRVNAELAALYPGNYIDMRAHLVGLYDPGNAQDVQDHAADLVPSSLRFDGIHLNDAGCEAVVARLQAFLAAQGW